MTDKEDPQNKQLNKNPLVVNLQLELFHSTKQLNLSETYENIPKEVSQDDPAIIWESERVALPVVKEFEVGGTFYSSEITPALLRDSKTGEYKSYFPYVREARVEYAIMSLAAKRRLDVAEDTEDNKIFTLKTSYYQIQQEIVEAINRIEKKNLAVKSCPYNSNSIKEALEILKLVNIKVTPFIKEKKNSPLYIFSRLKDVYLSDSKVVIELNSMIVNSISQGDWKVTDSASILASTSYYTLRIRSLLNMKFRYAEKGRTYNPSLSLLIEKIFFVEYKQKRQTLAKIVSLLESMHEIDKVVVEKKYDKRKIVDAILNIFPSDSFIKTMIKNNTLAKRVATAQLDDGKIIMEPMRSDFKTEREFKLALGKYVLKYSLPKIVAR